MSRPDLAGQADPYREGKIKDILCSGSVANRFVIHRNTTIFLI